jgi:predicted double-glycine peptidase
MWLAVVLVAATAISGSQAQGRPLLDVPYVAQTPELCGGAAVSMVMRYWGARDVVPEDFQALVVPAERGIPTTDLTAAIRARRWQALIGPPDPGAAWQVIEQDVNRGRPVIALIEVSPRTYHYVVVVGLTAGEIVVHDPARSPFHVMSRADFQRAWAVTKFWSVVILPPADMTPAPKPATPVVTAETPVTPCTGMVARGVDLALAGQAAESESVLLSATVVCATDAAAWRELAGLRFTQKNWTEAARLAEVAVRLAPDDEHARQVLATSRYLAGDLGGALKAWAPLSEPRIDTVTVTGALRTPHPSVIQASGLEARRVLTASMLQRSERRVGELPNAVRARVSFTPVDGLADVEIAMVEQTVVPKGPVPLGLLAARAVIVDELRLDVHGALRQAERFTARWRWTSARPRVVLAAAFPAPAWLTGVVAFEALWDKQTYTDGLRESRRRMSLELSDWATGHLRWRAGFGSDRFDGRAHVAGFGGAELRVADDRVALGASGQVWKPLNSGETFSGAGLTMAWRSTTSSFRRVMLASASVERVTTHAPRALWPSAGSGGRGALLRAHPLLTDDIVSGPLFGRSVLTSSLEAWQPVKEHLGQRLFVAAFVDAARARRFYADAGVGVRLATLGGTARLDVAHGLRGGGFTLSAGWMLEWPWPPYTY